MNKDEINVDKLNFINSLIELNLVYAKDYSDFIYQSLETNLKNYLNSKYSKREKYLDKVKRNLNKINDIELKKNNKKLFNMIIATNIRVLGENKLKDSNRYIRRIKQLIFNSKNYTELILNYINEYDSLLGLVNRKNSTQNYYENIVKQIKKNNKKKEDIDVANEVTYSVDKMGNTYANIEFVNDKMILDMSSFRCECSLYEQAVFNNDDFIKKDDVKYSSFEKKRRVFIKTMFELEKNMHQLSLKDIDITFPIDKMFKYAQDIVDGLYKEIIEYEYSNNVLDTLMNLSIEYYGCNKKIEKYKKTVDNILDKIVNIDKFVIDEFISSSNHLKSNSIYIEFKQIEGIFPDVSDIYDALNKKIIKAVRLYIRKWLDNLDNLEYVLKYMDIKYVSKFYVEVKNEIIQMSLNNMRITNKLIEFQKYIVKYMVKKFDLVESDILNIYLNDEKLF